MAILAEGGNLNNYAGAVDPDLLIRMPIGKAPEFPSLEEEALVQVDAMHHNVGPNDPERYRGLAREPKVGLIGSIQAVTGRRHFWHGYPKVPPPPVFRGELPRINCREEEITDLFISGTGEEAAQAYERLEPRLARSAAVNFIDGELVAPVRSRHSHYVSRHQICGANVPWHMTNTSEPHSDDMVEQACNPVSFDWMVKGVCGLKAVPEMMEEVERDQPFGSFFAFAELPDLPYVETSSSSLRAAAESATGNAFRLYRDELLNGEIWSRKVEEALTGVWHSYPLNLA